MKLRPGRQQKPHKTQVKVYEVFQMRRKLQRLHTETVNNHIEVSADLQKSQMFKVSQIEDSRGGDSDCYEWGTEAHGEGRDFARSSAMHRLRTSRPDCESLKDCSNDHMKLGRERKNEDHSSSAESQRVGKTR